MFPVPDFYEKLPAKSFQSLMVTGVARRLTWTQHPQHHEPLASAEVVALAVFAWLHLMKSWGHWGRKSPEAFVFMGGPKWDAHGNRWRQSHVDHEWLDQQAVAGGLVMLTLEMLRCYT